MKLIIFFFGGENLPGLPSHDRSLEESMNIDLVLGDMILARVHSR